MTRAVNICSAVLVAVAFCPRARAIERPIDVANSSVRIHVRKAGLFSAAGHEHWVTAPFVQGSVEEGEPSHVTFTFFTRTLTVEPDKGLRAKDQAEVQRTMQQKVLESERYPEISFRSTSVTKTSGDTWTVTGILALHGHSNPVSATVHGVQDKYVGAAASSRPTSAFNLSARAED
jgi:polyisoprenoid-binding protein YceI